MPNTAPSLSLLQPPRALDANARLLLYAARRIAAAGLNDAAAAAALLGHFGASYRRPLVLLRALMLELARSARRPILIAPCCCGRTTPAESAMLQAIRDGDTDPHAAAGSLAAVLGHDACLGAVTTAASLGGAFADLDRPLSRV